MGDLSYQYNVQWVNDLPTYEHQITIHANTRAEADKLLVETLEMQKEHHIKYIADQVTITNNENK